MLLGLAGHSDTLKYAIDFSFIFRFMLGIKVNFFLNFNIPIKRTCSTNS